jgi:hypothetical protein
MSSPSCTSIGNVGGMQVHCKTPAGAAYVRKITHPPTTLPTDYAGTPDCSAPNAVLLETKAEDNVPVSIDLPISPTASETKAASSIMFIQPSGMHVASYVFYKYGVDWIQPQSQAASTGIPLVIQTGKPAVLNSGYNVRNFTADAQKYRTTYKSATKYLNATDFSNQGTVTTSKFKADIITITDLSVAEMTHETRQNFLRALSCTKEGKDMVLCDDDEFEVVSSTGKKVAMTNKPRFYRLAADAQFSAQVWQLVTPRSDVPAPAPITLFPFSNTMWSISQSVLPTTASDVLMMSPKGATRLARDGDFVVQQQEGPIAPWTSTTSFPEQSRATIRTLPSCFISSPYLDGTSTWQTVYAPLYSDIGSSLSPQPIGDTPWNNLDWSITIFEGLTVNLGGSTAALPYITFKGFTGVEMQASPVSSLLPFQRLLPLPDASAMEMAAGIFHARPDSLPSAANDLASIAKAAITYLPTAITWLKDMFGSKQAQVTAQDPKTRERIVVVQRPAANGRTAVSIRARGAKRNAAAKANQILSGRMARMHISKNLPNVTRPASAMPAPYVNNNSASAPTSQRSKSSGRKTRK